MTDIWIAGLGVRAVNQVTREVERALRASREVLYLDAGVATKPYLEGLCPQVTALFEQSYSEERPRLNAYEHMAISVIRGRSGKSASHLPGPWASARRRARAVSGAGNGEGARLSGRNPAWHLRPRYPSR